LFSHFSISQQFFKLLTEESLELSADSDLACKIISEVQSAVMYKDKKKSKLYKTIAEQLNTYHSSTKRHSTWSNDTQVSPFN
jgi:hypothetical protein